MHRELTAKFLKDELSKMIELFPEEKRAIEYRYEHSLRVASIALDIAKKEGLMKIAVTLGLCCMTWAIQFPMIILRNMSTMAV